MIDDYCPSSAQFIQMFQDGVALEFRAWAAFYALMLLLVLAGVIWDYATMSNWQPRLVRVELPEDEPEEGEEAGDTQVRYMPAPNQPQPERPGCWLVGAALVVTVLGSLFCIHWAQNAAVRYWYPAAVLHSDSGEYGQTGTPDCLRDEVIEQYKTWLTELKEKSDKVAQDCTAAVDHAQESLKDCRENRWR